MSNNDSSIYNFLKIRVSEIRVNQIRVNQGLGVLVNNVKMQNMYFYLQTMA